MGTSGPAPQLAGVGRHLAHGSPSSQLMPGSLAGRHVRVSPGFWSWELSQLGVWLKQSPYEGGSASTWEAREGARAGRVREHRWEAMAGEGPGCISRLPMVPGPGLLLFLEPHAVMFYSDTSC